MELKMHPFQLYFRKFASYKAKIRAKKGLVLSSCQYGLNNK